MKTMPIASVAALALLSAQVLLHAQDSPERSFPAAAQPAWQKLQKALRCVEGSALETHCYWTKEITTRAMQFKQNGDLHLFGEVRRNADYEVIKTQTIGANTKYFFSLRKDPPQAPWQVDAIGTTLDGMNIGHPYGYSWAFGIIKHLEAPYTIEVMPLPVMVKEPGFVVEKIKVEEVAGRKLVHVAFTYSLPPGVKVDRSKGLPKVLSMHLTALRGGWMLLDPEWYWAIRQYEVENDGLYTTKGEINYRRDATGVPLPVLIKTQNFYNNGASDFTEVRFEKLSLRQIPEREFTLSAFDFPEPAGVVWESESRSYFWQIGAGVVVLGLLSARWIRKGGRPLQTSG